MNNLQHYLELISDLKFSKINEDENLEGLLDEEMEVSWDDLHIEE